MNVPKLSIVTISFNQAAFLERAILSVLDQSGVAMEYIVVDPGSTDGSREIIQRYAARITKIILDPDDGAADGLNKGLAAATAEYFAYLNSDDEYLPGALAEAVRVLDGDPALDVVYASGWMVDAEGRRLRQLIPTRRFNAPRYARGLATIVQQSSVMRTAALRDAGGFNVANRTCWDGEAFFEMARRGARFRRVAGQWAFFRIHAGSITGNGQTKRYREDQRRIFADIFGRNPTSRDRITIRIQQLIERLTDPAATIAGLRRRQRR